MFAQDANGTAMNNMRIFLTGCFLWLGSALHGATLELIMVEQPGCHWCERWDAEISEIYPKTEEGRLAPLRRVNLRNLPDTISFRSQPVFTPTFVLVEDGKELGRLEGYNGDEFFWFLLTRLLQTSEIGTETQ